MARQIRSSADKPESEPAKGKVEPAKPPAAAAKPRKPKAEGAAQSAEKPAEKRAPEKTAAEEKSPAKSESPPKRKPDDDLVRVRAYAIWISEGRPHGRDEDHWHRAREELDDEAE